jgi:hypothetical protein
MLLSPVAGANSRSTPDRLLLGRQAKVTWSGFHGVTFGEPLSDAARRLHGTVRSDEPRTDARFVYYAGEPVSIGGSMRWQSAGGIRFQVGSGETVGSFLALSDRVIFPRHAFIGEPLSRFRRSLGKGGRPERPEHNAATGYYLVGPHGRTLWAWGQNDVGVESIGLSESLEAARSEWGYEG